MDNLAAAPPASVADEGLISQGGRILSEAEARLLLLLTQPADQPDGVPMPQIARTLELLHAARVAWRGEALDDSRPLDRLRQVRRQEQTQERIAASLKSIGQLLANAAVELAACRPLLRNDPQTVEKGLASLENELRAGLDELRWILSDLQAPPMLHEMGLAASVARYAQRFSDHYGIRLATNSLTNLPRLPATVELAIFRIIQEALRNVARHARASHALITLTSQQDQWVIQISDNGRGFVPQDLTDASGLIDMQEWAEILQARLHITSAPGQGTTLILHVPVSST